MGVDELTKLPDHTAFQEKLSQTLEEKKKKGGVFTLAFIDLDGFLGVNKNYGHQSGDELLAQIAEILRENLEVRVIVGVGDATYCLSEKSVRKETTLIGRYGGDEFAIIFDGIGSEIALIMLEEVRKLIEGIKFTCKTEEGSINTYNITLSIGLASFPKDAQSPEELKRRADEALYQAKTLGRNKVCLPPPKEGMTLKTSYYTPVQLKKLTKLSEEVKKTESFLLREALDDLFIKYNV